MWVWRPTSRFSITLLLLNKASVYNVTDDFLIRRANPTIAGSIESPMTIPYSAMPAFLTVTPGTAAVTVAKKQTLTLAPGTSVSGSFFVAGQTSHGEGSERVGDLLNAQPGFFPFELRDLRRGVQLFLGGVHGLCRIRIPRRRRRRADLVRRLRRVHALLRLALFRHRVLVVA